MCTKIRSLKLASTNTTAMFCWPQSRSIPVQFLHALVNALLRGISAMVVDGGEVTLLSAS